MLVLGTTADDKGSQLESLVKTVLLSQGYTNVHTNVVTAGGNELDITAVRSDAVLTSSHQTPLLGEAKAYADAVSTPAWQRFLGKILLARLDKPHTHGVLIALNGVNGNVRGSYEHLRERESAITIVDGDDLLSRAIATHELSTEARVLESAAEQFGRSPTHTQAAYYDGGYLWVLRWDARSYSIMDGNGSMLSAQRVEQLRPSLQASVTGDLVAYAEALAEVEELHRMRVEVISNLLRGTPLPEEIPEGVVSDLRSEPFCAAVGSDAVALVDPAELDAAAITRFFLSLFEHRLPLASLSFMTGGHHLAHFHRLIDLIPEIHPWLHDSGDLANRLSRITPYFPSAWAVISTPLPYTALDADDATPQTSEMQRHALSEAVIEAIRGDFANVVLRGYLHDVLGIAELEDETTLTVKSTTGPLGNLDVHTRLRIGELGDELSSEAGTRHVVIRLLPGVAEPWEPVQTPPTAEAEVRQNAGGDE
ncbi:restriction endonuclease [Microbacterium sp. BH-3-3-3]|uniref:restriction endonuclease n=1 Tax=Microbacterium sp. BH-3-3-3 TaxID=1906742 RepID=UPI0011A65277|nr:restriction endonuclease [Microbacterium sp. BH-3-3-3]